MFSLYRFFYSLYTSPLIISVATADTADCDFACQISLSQWLAAPATRYCTLP